MPERPITCALLSSTPWDYAAAIALACDGLEFRTLRFDSLDPAHAPNPFALPEDDRATVSVLCNSWHEWLESHAPDRVDAVLRELEQRSDVVVALDGVDAFALGLPRRVFERVALVIKPQGLYRDRELYNYEVGPRYPGAVWTEKARPRSEPYRSVDLEKLRLSVPCFMADLPALRNLAREREARAAATVERAPSRYQRAARNAMERAMWPLLLVSAGRRSLDVQCVVSLTHAQRIDAMRLLDGFSGRRGLIARWPDGPPGPSEEELLAAAQPYLTKPVPRMSHLRDMRRHRIVFAPTGYGEITYRHAEALRTGAALVCQDLSHVEMMFPLRDDHDAVFCRPDLADATSVVRDLLGDDDRRLRVARTGRRSFAAWARDWRRHIHSGIEQPIREALVVV